MFPQRVPGAGEAVPGPPGRGEEVRRGGKYPGDDHQPQGDVEGGAGHLQPQERGLGGTGGLPAGAVVQVSGAGPEEEGEEEIEGDDPGARAGVRVVGLDDQGGNAGGQDGPPGVPPAGQGVAGPGPQPPEEGVHQGEEQQRVLHVLPGGQLGQRDLQRSESAVSRSAQVRSSPVTVSPSCQGTKKRP